MSNEKDIQNPENMPEDNNTNQDVEVREAPEGVVPVERRILVQRSPTKLEIKSGYVLRKVGQAYMVMPTGPRMKEYEGMITLNETGAFLFKEMQKPDVTLDSLAAACMAEYDATAEEASKAVDAFMFQCFECGLMEYEEKFFNPEGKEVTLEDIEKGRA